MIQKLNPYLAFGNSTLLGIGKASTSGKGYHPQMTIKTGYEISFTRYFYKPQPLRTLEKIRADILALEYGTEGLLGEIIGTPTR